VQSPLALAASHDSSPLAFSQVVLVGAVVVVVVVVVGVVVVVVVVVVVGVVVVVADAVHRLQNFLHHFVIPTVFRQSATLP
jgi:hypothetical protein